MNAPHSSASSPAFSVVRSRGRSKGACLLIRTAQDFSTRSVAPLLSSVEMTGSERDKSFSKRSSILHFTFYIYHLEETRSTARLTVPVRRSAQGDKLWVFPVILSKRGKAARTEKSLKTNTKKRKNRTFSFFPL